MKRLALLIPALFCAAAGAQDELPEEETQVRRYTVEVIIFEYAEQVSVGTEVFAPDEPVVLESPEPPAEFVFEDVPPEPEPPAERVSGPEFVLHIEDEFSLMDVASRLELLDVYEPLMHFAWTQVTLPEEDTVPIELRALAAPPERLTGTFRLYLSRYLHLVVDLTLDEATANGEPVAIDESAFAYADDRFGFGGGTETSPVQYRIQEDRIFKNGDLRYFDHPKFGVLAKITRVEEEEPEPVDPETRESSPQNLVGGIDQ